MGKRFAIISSMKIGQRGRGRSGCNLLPSALRYYWQYIRLVLPLFGTLLAPVALVGSVYAFSSAGLYEGTSYGPNHQYISNNVTMEYIVSADTYTDIYSTRLNIYTSTRNPVTVRVYGADVCSNSVNNTTDEIYRSMSSGTYLGAYMLKNAAGAMDRQQFYYRTCGSSSYVDLNVTPGTGDFNPELNMYVLTFSAQVTSGMMGSNTFLNGFRVQVVSDAGAMVGQASSSDGLTARDFGMQVGVPRDGTTYADFYMPFSTDCSVVDDGVGTKTIEIYDADYGDTSIQPVPFFVNLQGRRFGSSAWTDVPPIRTSGNPEKLTLHSAANNEYYPTAGNKETSRYTFTVNKNYEYRLYVTRLFNNNTLQFSLPFPAISKQRSCTGAQLTGRKITTAPTDQTNSAISGLSAGIVGSQTSTAQPYTISGIAVPSGGARKTAVVDPPAASSGWNIVGYAFCDLSRTDCTAANLQYGGRYYHDTSTYNVPVFMEPGKRYEMRWIFDRVQPVMCYTSGSDLISPSLIDKNTKFTVKPAVTVRSDPANPRISVTIAGPGLSYTSSATATQVGSSNNYQATFANIGPTRQGNQTYTMHWTYQDGATTRDCNEQFDTVKKPTFSVNNGDLYSGASVMAWNNDGSNQLFGSRATHAVLAGGSVFGFPSALSAILGTHTGNELTFANIGGTYTPADGAKNYGGAFEAIPAGGDVPSDVDANTAYASAPSINLSSLVDSGKYKVKDGVAISGNLGAGVKVTLVGDGLVTVRGNIDYNGAPYSSAAQIPRLNVFAGQIVVLGNVTTMKGFYVAAGNFYSCGHQVAGEYAGYEYAEYNDPDSDIRSDCGSSLSVEGSVQAGELILARTGGDGYFTGINSASTDAETFTETPEFWMAQSNTDGNNVTWRYDYYVGLPPVL